MTHTNYKHKCCGNCEYFLPVLRASGSNSTIITYHVCTYLQRGIDDAYEEREWECYKPASKKHMAGVKSTIIGILDQITEVNE